MEYITRRFENTHAGLAQKDATTRQLASQGFRIINEQIEQGHIKGSEQCCGALICLPLIFLAGRTPGAIIVTYGRDVAIAQAPAGLFCNSCGSRVSPGIDFCGNCGEPSRNNTSSNEGAATLLSERKQIARERTQNAEQFVEDINRILRDAAGRAIQMPWDLARRQYQVPKPAPPNRMLPSKPDYADYQYTPTLWTRFIPYIVNRKNASAQLRFRQSESEWEQQRAAMDSENEQHHAASNEWQADKDRFEAEEKATLELRRSRYLEKSPAALEAYWKDVLLQNGYPLGLNPNFAFTFVPQSRVLVIDCRLPSFDSMPKIKEVEYVPAKRAFRETEFAPEVVQELYEKLVYGITLRTLHELSHSDLADSFDDMIFNGFVEGIDRAVGQEIASYIVSVKASKRQMLAINLAQVEPRACLARFTGSISQRMSEMVPVDRLIS